MFKMFCFFLYLSTFSISYSQRTWGYFISGSELSLYKFHQGIAMGITHSKSYKDNNKWQSIMQIGYFPGSYSYTIQPVNSANTYHRDVTAKNFLVRIGKEYGFLFINRRTKKLFLGPSLSLDVLSFYEQGYSKEIGSSHEKSDYSNFNLEMGISPFIFMEYEVTPYQNSFFARLEGGYIFNPIDTLAPYGGFPGSWIISFSIGYRINHF